MKNRLFILLGCVFFNSQQLQAEFTPTSLRYLSGYDFEIKLTSLFDGFFQSLPNQRKSYRIMDTYEVCFGSEKSASVVFGFNSPATGEPMMLGPNTSTVQAIQHCLLDIDQNISSSGQTIFYKNLLPNEIFIKLSQSNYSVILNNNLTSQFTDEEIKKIIAHLVEQALGTDETILSYSLIKNIDLFQKHLFTQINKNETLSKTIFRMLNILILRDEFLMY